MRHDHPQTLRSRTDIADDVRAEKPSFWSSVGKNSTVQSQPVSSCQYDSPNIPAIPSQDRKFPSYPASRVKLAVQGRYNMGVFSSVLIGSLQGIAERPLPCNYNVIQFVCALSRR